MNIRYPIYEGVYRILTSFSKQWTSGTSFKPLINMPVPAEGSRKRPGRIPGSCKDSCMAVTTGSGV